MAKLSISISVYDDCDIILTTDQARDLYKELEDLFRGGEHFFEEDKPIYPYGNPYGNFNITEYSKKTVTPPESKGTEEKTST